MSKEEVFARINTILQFQMTGSDEQRIAQQENEVLLTSRLDLLPLLFAYLSECDKNNYALLIGLKLISKLLEKRGCLLTPEQLQELVGTLFTAVRELAPVLGQMIPVMNIAAKTVAVAYHLVYEIDCSVGFDDVFGIIASGDQNLVLIGVKILQNIVECFYIKGFSMPHLVPGRREQLKTAFRRSQLTNFFQNACEILLASESTQVADAAMDLLLACLKYDTKDDESKADMPRIRDYQFVTDQQTLQKYCMSTGIPTVLFRIYDQHPENAAMQNKAMEVLMYFSSASTSNRAARYWGEPRLNYLQFVAANLTRILNSNINRQVTQELARLMRMVSYLLPVPLFLRSGELAFSFFAAAQKFSLDLWTNMRDEQYKDAANYMLSFWALADISSGIRQRPEDGGMWGRYVEMFPNVFREYIRCLMEAIDPEPAAFEERFPNFETFIDEARDLWSVSNMVQQQAVEHVSSIMNDLTNELISSRQPVTVHRLSIMILIIATKLKMRTGGMGEGDALLVPLISSVFSYIDRTNPGLSALAQTLGPSMEFIEKALQFFVVQFKRDFLSSQRASERIERIYQGLAVANSRKAAFDLIVNRFLTDLKEFTQWPGVLHAALDFLDELIAAKGEADDLKQFAASNELLQGLIQRRFFVDFRAVPNIDETKKIVPMLNRIYARAIKTQDAWNQFLLHFDSLYATIAAGNYQNSADIFFLNREVYGVLTGTSSHIDYLHVFRWFMQKHVEHTLASIRAQSQNRNIVHIIYRTWYMICSNKGKKLMVPSESAEGIVLFHHSLSVCHAIMECGFPIEDRAAFICKIIRPSLSETYANFDVMKYYGDTSAEQMVDMFFGILRASPFEWFSSLSNGVMTILGALESLARRYTAGLENPERLSLTLKFIWRSLIEFTGRKDAAEKKKALDCFKSACDSLKLIMLRLLGSGHRDWSMFHFHFVALMDAIIESHDYIGDAAAAPLCYIAKCDTAFVEKVFAAISDSFDEQYRAGITGLLTETFTKVNEVDSPENVQKFRNALYGFKRGIAKYAVCLSDIQILRPFLIPGSE